MTPLIPIALLTAAVVALAGFTVPRGHRIIASLVFAFVAVALAQSSGSANIAVNSAWCILAAASIGPLILGIRNGAHAREGLAVATTMLWPACLLYVWQVDVLTPTAGLDLLTGVLLTIVVGTVATVFVKVSAQLYEAGDGKLWNALVLGVLVLIAVLPWAGSTDSVPLAISSTHDALAAPQLVTVMSLEPMSALVTETQTIATGNVELLYGLRQALLWTALASLLLLAFAAITRHPTARRFSDLTSVITAIVALLIPIAAFFSVMDPPVPRAHIEAATLARLSLPAATSYLPFGTLPTANGHFLLFGLPVAAGLLPGLATGLFTGLAQSRRLERGDEQTHNYCKHLLIVLAVIGAVYCFGMFASELSGSGYGLDRAPWSNLLSGLLIVTGTVVLGRDHPDGNRFFGVGMFLVLVVFLGGIIGPGESWFP